MMTTWRQHPAVRNGLIVFVVLRVVVTLWAVGVLTLMPLPATPDEETRPYLQQPILTPVTASPAAALLGPWQRFDTNHYLRIAQQGYAHEADSVFPPLYPLLIRGLGTLFGGTPTADLAAALLISNLALLALFILFHHIAAAEIGPDHATRALVYFALFPTGFFLFAGYTESLFILLALGSLWAGRNGRFPLAGLLGLLASLTRLTGWVLVLPLAYEFFFGDQGPGRQNRGSVIGTWLSANRKQGNLQSPIATNHSPFSILNSLFSILLPALGSALFLLLRWALGLRPLGQIYADYWYQTTGFPGLDMATAVQTLFLGGTARAGEFTLIFDLLMVFFLAGTTVWVWRRLGPTWGLYNALLLLFILLPTSELKPLYSFSRYALAFIPTFFVLAEAGKRPFLNRLILYPSILLYLWFSGQFFVWGWVA